MKKLKINENALVDLSDKVTKLQTELKYETDYNIQKDKQLLSSILKRMNAIPKPKPVDGKNILEIILKYDEQNKEIKDLILTDSEYLLLVRIIEAYGKPIDLRCQRGDESFPGSSERIKFGAKYRQLLRYLEKTTEETEEQPTQMEQCEPSDYANGFYNTDDFDLMWKELYGDLAYALSIKDQEWILKDNAEALGKLNGFDKVKEIEKLFEKEFNKQQEKLTF